MGLAAVVLAACLGQASGAEGSCPAGQGSCLPGRPRAHHWPNVRGQVGSLSVSATAAPWNLSRPSWSWHHPDGRYASASTVGPVIDDELNLYVSTPLEAHKFSRDGALLWSVSPPPGCNCGFPDAPSIMEDSMYLTTTAGHVLAFDLATGGLRWQVRHFMNAGADAGFVTSHDGVVVVGMRDASGLGGSRHLVGLSSADGTVLWTFTPDVPTWNTMAVFADDGTVLFQDIEARAYRLGLRTGTLLWKAGGRKGTWTDGGLMVGPNGVAYAVGSNGTFSDVRPFMGGSVHAYRLRDGAELWSRETPHPIFSWPVVAKLGGEGYTVVVTTGALASRPWQMIFLEIASPLLRLCVLLGACSVMCRGVWGAAKCTGGCLLFGLATSGVLVLFITHRLMQSLPSEILALDAATGEVRWRHELPVWHRVAARGDEDFFLRRLWSTPWRTACLPASFGSPTVDGAGSLYVGYMDGRLYGIRDADGDGAISGSEVTAFDAGAGFLHSGPALAPGLFAVTSCDSLFVWSW